MLPKALNFARATMPLADLSKTKKMRRLPGDVNGAED